MRQECEHHDESLSQEQNKLNWQNKLQELIKRMLETTKWAEETANI